MSNISHERSVPTSERSSTTEIGQVNTGSIPISQATVGQASNSMNSAASTNYSSPSPPPPAPLSSLQAQPLHSYESVTFYSCAIAPASKYIRHVLPVQVAYYFMARRALAVVNDGCTILWSYGRTKDFFQSPKYSFKFWLDEICD